MNSSPKVIMITGAAGYIGAMLCHQFSKAPNLEKIIAIDMRTMPAILKDNKKIVWITAKLSDGIWKIPAHINKPEVVIHCAWQKREIYGKDDLQKKLNIDGSRAVFDFVFSNEFVKKLIHFSSALSYGAYPDNNLEKPFAEDDQLREDNLRHLNHKRVIEEDLRSFYEGSGKNTQIVILRPSSITGPRARSLNDKNELSFIPVGSDKWFKQYIHEDDITDIVGMFTFGGKRFGVGYEVFNLSPRDYVAGRDIGRLLNKTIVTIPPLLVRMTLFLVWHIFGGKFSISRGEWSHLSYPVPIDGSKITNKYGFEYSYSSREALEKNEGRYAESESGEIAQSL